MKTAEELKELKEEVETLSAKLRDLTEEELKQVTGGTTLGRTYWKGRKKDSALGDDALENAD